LKTTCQKFVYLIRETFVSSFGFMSLFVYELSVLQTTAFHPNLQKQFVCHHVENE
jgi:hypothetical protein